MGVYGMHTFCDEPQAVQAVKVATAHVRNVVLYAFLCHDLIALLSLQQLQQHIVRSGQHLFAAVEPVSGLHFLQSVVPSG